MLPPREVYNGNWSHLHHLSLADPSYHKPGKIDLLLGAEVYSEILTEGLKKGPQGSPVAQNTHLGWILTGQLHKIETTQSYRITISMHINIEVDESLQKFWELESDVACPKMLSDERRRCEEHFAKTHKRDTAGRYVVSLPFKDDDPSCQYGQSREIAEKRLLQIERRLQKDTQLKKEYDNVMQEYLKLDHMEDITNEEDRGKETAVLLTRLLKEIAEHLKVKKGDIYAYTDSKVVLSWIQGDPSQWKTFIANRTSEIWSELPSHHWNHVVTSENPADLASRGVPASALKQKDLWWKGPSWLKNTEVSHEVPTDLPKELPLQEKRVHFVKMNLGEKVTKIFERYSSLEKLLRVIATCKRFRNVKTQELPTHLTPQEIESALFGCILLSQEEEFAEELLHLRENKPLKKTSRLRSLNPFLDKSGILRVGGRLRHANIPEDAKHQILLTNNPLSKLIVAQAHRKTLHGGPTLMLNYIRQKFLILSAKNLIRQEVHKCVVCARERATTRTQLIADLPIQRVRPSRPFVHSGLDFAGPIDLRLSKGRGCKTLKGYLCIFVCMTTRAMHIEVVSGLDSESFVAAFKRFTSRRGYCSDIWSDNAMNFIAGNKQLKAMFEGQFKSLQNEMQDLLARDGTTWHNIPASAPHFGGLWEAGVRSVKHHLKRILGNTTLTFEEMCTVTTQIEACLNSRPISQISDSPDDLLPLTPGHFLIGEPPIVVPERSYLDTNINRLTRWQLVQRLTQHFWQRWSQEYLSRLQQRPKWATKRDNDFKLGSLVLVKDENLPPSKWSLARILEVHPGKDGLSELFL